jgi:hypothetical protein
VIEAEVKRDLHVVVLGPLDHCRGKGRIFDVKHTKMLTVTLSPGLRSQRARERQEYPQYARAEETMSSRGMSE